MAGTASPNLQGNFKEAYASQITDIMPGATPLQKAVPFVARERRTGNLFHLPVIVTSCQGFTYGLVSSGILTLNDAVTMQTLDAQIQGVQLCLQNQISFESMAKSRQNSFKPAQDLVIDDSVESMRKRIEIGLFYGQSTKGLGLVTQSSQSNVSATQTRITITPGQWSAGIWSVLQNGKFNFYTGTSTLVSSGADAVFTLLKLDPDNRYLYITGTATGITALEAAVGAAATVRPYFQGAYGVESAGLELIMTNTGTLFNIDADQYSLWKSNVMNITGSLNYGRIQQGVAKATVRGLDEDVTAWVNPMAFIDVSNQITALRRFTNSEDNKKGAMGGGDKLNFYGPQGGMVSVVPHLFVKAGDCFITPLSRLMRVGAIDMSFSLLGNDSKEDFLYPIPGSSAFFFYLYSLQALLVTTPARCTYITGFLPTEG